MQNVQRAFDLRCINTTKRVSVEIRDDLDGIDTPHGLGRGMRLPKFSLINRKPDLQADSFGKLTQPFLGITDPQDGLAWRQLHNITVLG